MIRNATFVKATVFAVEVLPGSAVGICHPRWRSSMSSNELSLTLRAALPLSHDDIEHNNRRTRMGV